MYNVYNTGVNNRSGGCSCGCWNGGWQRVCRDACGNLMVRNANSGCGCQCNCCHHQCGCNTGNGTVGNNGTTGSNGGTGTNNGVFCCVTFCGYGNDYGTTTVQPRSGCRCGSSYYARQYGLTCDGNGECTYNFTND